MNKPNIQIWKIERIIPYEKNAKKHPPEQVAKIAKSIQEFGPTQPIVVDKNGVIIAGHGRRKAVESLGLTEFPVWVRDDLDEQQVRALRLADNRVAESKIDTEIFKAELADLDYDLEGIFDAKELQFSVADLGEINMEAFVEDVGAAVQQQERETKEKIEALTQKRVGIARVMGIKDVAGSSQIYIQRMLAEIERRTGAKGEDALVAYAKDLCAME